MQVDRVGYPGLDLFFTGPASSPPQVSAIGYALASGATKPIQVFVASDSTACDQSGGAFGGWGQMLPEYFGPPVSVANYANERGKLFFVLGSSELWPGRLMTSHWPRAICANPIRYRQQQGGRGRDSPRQTSQNTLNDAKAANVTPNWFVRLRHACMFSGSAEGDQS